MNTDLKQKYLVYKITNRVNGRFYIGITMQPLKKRMAGHRNTIKRSGLMSKITRAMKNFGYEAFTIEAIDTAFGIDEANEKEIYYIRTLKPHYNLTLGGDGMKGFNRPKSVEHRQKLSKASKESWKSPSHRLLVTLARSNGQKQKGPIKHKESFRQGTKAYWTIKKIRHRTLINKILNSRIYRIQNNKGEVFEVTDIDSFCLKHRLLKSTLQRTAPGMPNHGRSYKGFSLLEIPIRRFASIGDVSRHLNIGRVAAAKMRINNPKMFVETVSWMKDCGLIHKDTQALPDFLAATGRR